MVLDSLWVAVDVFEVVVGGFRSFYVLVLTDLENPPQPPKNEFAEGWSNSNSILKLEQFLKPCVLSDYKEKEKTKLFEVI